MDGGEEISVTYLKSDHTTHEQKEEEEEKQPGRIDTCTFANCITDRSFELNWIGWLIFDARLLFNHIQ